LSKSPLRVDHGAPFLGDYGRRRAERGGRGRKIDARPDKIIELGNVTMPFQARWHFDDILRVARRRCDRIWWQPLL
jgi:hypothetical protein